MNKEGIKFSENISIIKYNNDNKEEDSTMNESVKWKCKARIEKYNSEESYNSGKPDEVLPVIGNTALYDGLALLWRLATGLGDDETNYFINVTNTFIGVGNSSATAAPTQTGLLGTSKFYAPMDQTTGVEYPLINDNVITVRSKFGPNDANFAWNEWGILNGNPNDLDTRDPETVIQLNRKVEAMGVKVVGATWIVVADITINP